MKIKNVLVVEDERMFREFLVGWLRREGLTVVGEAGSVAEARGVSEREELDLVVLDLDLPDGEGIGYAEWLLERRAMVCVLVLTAHAGRYPVAKLKRSGVMGVLDKGETSGTELRRAVQAMAEGRTYYSERVERTFRELVRETGSFYRTLSPREEELVKLFGLGHSNEAIAAQLGLSVATVQGHRRNVMGKVRVNSTPELIIWAIRNGFVRGPQIRRLA